MSNQHQDKGFYRTMHDLFSQPWLAMLRQDSHAFLRDIFGSLNARLFHANMDFWAHHIGGCVVLFLFDFALNTIFTPSRVFSFYLSVTLLWMVAIFLTGLILRRHYIDAGWESQPQALVLLKSAATSILFAFIIAVFMTIVVSLLSGGDLIHYYRMGDPYNSVTGVFGEFFFRSWLTSSFYLLCWQILYVGITSKRRAKEIEVANLRLENSLREAELSGLSNQLNPHFLFNALNNIRFMIQEDAANAERMLMALSSVLRYSLESSRQDKVLLEQELEISNRYIELIKIQFEERLKFDILIPDQALHWPMPPMILQMLLENAVKHGVENIKAGGLIDVHVCIDGERLVMLVSNDLPENFVNNNHTTGLGLLNISQRLDILYGARASMDVGIDGGRFCVTLILPRH